MFSREAVWFIPHGNATVLLTAGSIGSKVVEMERQFVSSVHLWLTATFDHHIIDGSPAARFMNLLLENIIGGHLLHDRSPNS